MAMSGLDLGPCQVLFGTEGAEADLGKTEGGVEIAFATDIADLASDQHGTSPEDQVIVGQGATITVPLAEYTLANLATALNQTLVGDVIDGANLVGTKMSTKAQSLLLKKYVDGAVSSDEDDWVRFPEAAPQGSPTIRFSKSDQRIIEVVFTAFPDASDNLYYIGEEPS
jgi:hypothetical protein